MSRPRETRTLHFDLSHTPAAAEHTLNIGGRQITLTSHTADSRTSYRLANPALNRVPDEKLTHYASDSQFLAGAIQSYYVTNPGPAGKPPNLSLAGILVPKAVASRAHDTYSGAAKGPFGSKARALVAMAATGSATDEIQTADLADFQTTADAATYVVFHHPNLMAFSESDSTDGSGSDFAMRVMSIIQSCPAFDNLSNAIQQQGPAQNEDGVNNGYEGWANAEIWPNQTNVPPEQQQWWYSYSDATNQAALPVVQQALTAVRNDPTLDGKSYRVDYGSHNTQTGTSPAVSVAPAATTKFRSFAALDSSGGYSFSLSDGDYNHGRQVVVNSISGRDVSMTINNSYWRHLAVFYRFLGDDGKKIALADLPAPWNAGGANWTTYDAYVDYVEPRGRFLGIPTDDATSKDIDVTIPAGAAGVMILLGGMGIGDLPSDDDSFQKVQVPGAILTGVIDLGLPTFFLLLGATTDHIGANNFVSLIEWILQTFSQEVAISAFNSGDVSKSDLQTEWAGDILQSIITEAPQAFTDLLKAAMKEAGTEAALSWVPVAGTLLKGLNILGTLAEITETVADICLSPWVIPDTLSLTMNVDVTLSWDTTNSYEFPSAATKLQVTLTQVQGQPQQYSVTLTDIFPKYPANCPSITTSFSIPAGGVFTVTANFTTDDGWVAGTGTSGPVVATLASGQSSLAVPITVETNPYPITTSTTYVHKQILQGDGNGGRTWVNGPAPTATITNLGGNQLVELDDLASITVNARGSLGYAWRGKSPSLVEAGTASTTMVELYTAQNINLNASGSVDSALRVIGNQSEQYGFASPIFIEYDPLGDPDGMHFIVAPALDPTTLQTEYHAFKVSLSGTAPIDLVNAQSYGRFASAKIDAIAVHPRGHVIALNATNEKIEILTVPSQPTAIQDAAYATQTGGEGTYVGLLHGSKAVAITKDGNTFFVLESLNQRIQAFSVNGGTSVQYFNGQPWISLTSQDQGREIVWLDMAVDPTGYIFVLSYDANGSAGAPGPFYRMDIYGPEGNLVTRTTNVNAARLTVDPYRAVYTANYALLSPLVGQRPEPSVSLWTGSGAT